MQCVHCTVYCTLHVTHCTAQRDTGQDVLGQIRAGAATEATNRRRRVAPVVGIRTSVSVSVSSELEQRHQHPETESIVEYE